MANLTIKDAFKALENIDIEIIETPKKKIVKLSEAVANKKLKEAEESEQSKVADFIKDAVEGLKKEEATNYKYDLDGLLGLFVGWSAGYGEEKRDDCIQSEENPDYAINVGIKVKNPADWAEFDYLNFPYHENGEVEDLSISIEPDEDYNKLAQYVLEMYGNVKDLDINDDGLIIEDKKEVEVDESCKLKEEKLQEKNWKVTLKSGLALRKAIRNEDFEEIRKQLLNCYNELEANNIIDSDELEEIKEEIVDSDWDTDDEVDYYLDKFYDLCDDMNVWVGLFESKKPVIKIKPDSKKVVIDKKDTSEVGEPGNPIQQGLRGRTSKLEAVEEPTDMKSRLDKFVNKDMEVEESCKKQVKESYGEEAFATLPNGVETYAIGTTRSTRNYNYEDIKFVLGSHVGYGTERWLNRPWHRFTFANALREAMLEVGISKEFAQECIDHAGSLKQAIQYFAEHYPIEKGVEESCEVKEDTVKQNGKWVNKGKEGTHGTFKTKKAADAQRKAMFARGYKTNEAYDSVKDFAFEITDVGFEGDSFKKLEDGVYYGIGTVYSVDKDGLEYVDDFDFTYNKDKNIVTIDGWFSKEAIDWYEDDEITDIEAMLLDNLKTNKPEEELDEACKLKEEPQLEPIYDGRKSFYGKADWHEEQDGTKVLYSYDTKVCEITPDGKVKLLSGSTPLSRGYKVALWRYSPTTLRHVKEFLKQNGFKADSVKQMEKDYLSESLTEGTLVNINDTEEVKKGIEELEKPVEAETTEKIVDVDADTVEKIKDSYIGNVILQCPVCRTLVYKEPDKLVKDEETELYNLEDECPHCGSVDGYELVGQVAKADVEIPGEEEEEEEKPEELPVEEPVEEVEDEEEFTFESLDTDKFDNLINRYMHEVYSNVGSYETTSANVDDENNQIIVEGKIKFNSGKEKTTKFVFEAHLKTVKGKYKFKGLNETFSKTKGFTLTTTLNENMLVPESFWYNYNVNQLNESKQIKGSVRL